MSQPKSSCLNQQCRHPQPFHPGSGPCKAYGCSCPQFQAKEVAQEPAGLAQALKQGYPGLEEALKDPTLGHQAVARKFPFTSETSVRRWRAGHSVMLKS